MASKYRQKQLEKVGLEGTNVSERQLKKLVDYETLREKELKLEKMREEREAKEAEELTLQPKTNKKMNDLYAQLGDQVTTGDRNKDLFNRSKLKNKQNKESNDYWFERQGDECKFKP